MATGSSARYVVPPPSGVIFINYSQWTKNTVDGIIIIIIIKSHLTTTSIGPLHTYIIIVIKMDGIAVFYVAG